MHKTLSRLVHSTFPSIHRGALDTLQLNLGYRCNLSCVHCHVSAGPRRTEEMSLETVETVIEFVDTMGIRTVDMTGGAPELNPHFRYLVEALSTRGVAMIDRCNLTILLEPDQEDLAEFLALHRVGIVASLPCYLDENVDKQRGKGVYGASIEGLQQLNALGYGREGSGLVLDLVFNPQGPVLPPSQVELEAAYKRELLDRHGVVFDRLLTIANMPVGRFGSVLISKGQFDGYMDVLRAAHQDSNIGGVMCRSLVSVDWEGFVYDCDFNQMLGLPIRVNGSPKARLRDLLGLDLTGRPVAVRDHCFGCTAGQGSSCGGALN